MNFTKKKTKEDNIEKKINISIIALSYQSTSEAIRKQANPIYKHTFTMITDLLYFRQTQEDDVSNRLFYEYS
jgi:hypothetical protein